MKVTAKAYLKDGVLFIRNRKELDESLKKIFAEGKDILVTFEKVKSKRSDNQHRYWWACMTLLAESFGYTKEEMHEICKYLFLKTEKVDEKTGEVFEYLRSSTELTKSEFSEMTEAMIRWSAEHGVVIPEPNEQLNFI